MYGFGDLLSCPVVYTDRFPLHGGARYYTVLLCDADSLTSYMWTYKIKRSYEVGLFCLCGVRHA